MGMSEAAGVLEHLNQLVRDGVAREFLRPTVLTKWEASGRSSSSPRLTV